MFCIYMLHDELGILYIIIGIPIYENKKVPILCCKVFAKQSINKLHVIA